MKKSASEENCKSQPRFLGPMVETISLIDTFQNEKSLPNFQVSFFQLIHLVRTEFKPNLTEYMLALESRRFPVLAEVSFCIWTLPNL